MNRFKGLKTEGVEYFNHKEYEGITITWSGNRGNKIRDREVYEFGEYNIIYNKKSKEYLGDSERMDYESKEFLQYLIDQIEIKGDSLEKGIQFLEKVIDNFDKIKVIN